MVEAKDLPGLRLALTVGGSAPWSMAAKSFFEVKQIPYIDPDSKEIGRSQSELSNRGEDETLQLLS